MMFRRSYHRISDDSISSFGGHDTLASAIKEAIECLASPDIDRAWVRDPNEKIVWRRSKAQIQSGE
jgi:hypothetical protein